MIIIVGESASGKTTVAKLLEDRFNMKMITTYTTRPPREGEINHRDYHFISNEEFDKLFSQDFFAETAEYRGWKYGSAKEDYRSDRNVVVLTPHGLRQVKKAFSEEDKDGELGIISVYLSVPRRDRLVKMLQRGDNIDEACRRSLSDVGQFDGIQDEVDFIIYNDGYRFDPLYIATSIDRMCVV